MPPFTCDHLSDECITLNDRCFCEQSLLLQWRWSHLAHTWFPKTRGTTRPSRNADIWWKLTNSHTVPRQTNGRRWKEAYGLKIFFSILNVYGCCPSRQIWVIDIYQINGKHIHNITMLLLLYRTSFMRKYLSIYPGKRCYYNRTKLSHTFNILSYLTYCLSTWNGVVQLILYDTTRIPHFCG